MLNFKRSIATFLLMVLLVGLLPLQAFALESETEEIPAVTETTEEIPEATEETPEATEEIPAATEAAETTEYAAPVVRQEIIINPLYADIFTEEDFAFAEDMPMLLEDEVYTSLEDAAEAMAAAMSNRQSNIVIYLDSKTAIPNVHNAVWNAAMEHTGVPGQGDNLKYQHGGASITYSDSYSGGTYHYYIKYAVKYMTTLSQEQKVTAAVAELRSQLGLSSMTNLEKIRTVYNWMCDNITYDYDGLADDSDLLEYTAYDAIVNHSAVCQGYANLFYRLMLEEGIDCRIVSGTSDGQGHAWNIVKIGSKYYNLDATWDADWKCRYFLKGSTNFNADHTSDSEFTTSAFTSKYPIDTADYVMAMRSGTCGTSANWSIDNAGRLIISGTGAMNDYAANTDTPWNQYYMCIDEVVVEEGITYIGNRAFQALPIVKAAVGKDVTSIGEYAFGSCRYLTTVSLPAGLKTVGWGAFYNSSAISTVIFCGSEAQWNGIAFDSYNTAVTDATRQTHNYVNNVCTACGDADCDTNGHVWVNATCTEAKYCAACKISEGSALGHDWVDATCTEAAYCTRCGLAGEAKLGHSWAAATCENPKTCGTCGLTSGSALGHNMLSATCTLPERCSRCDKTEGDALGHNMLSATCTQPKRCSRCSYTEGTSLGHDWVEASCLTPKTCNRCGETEGTKLGHDWLSANCLDPKTCDRCGLTSGSALGHNYATGVCTRCSETDPEYRELKIVTQPVSVAVYSGETAAASVVAEGTDLTYQWYYTTGGTATIFYESSSTTASYSTQMSAAKSGRRIYCVITDKYGDTLTTDTVTLSLRTPLVITAQPASVSVAAGETATVTVKAQGDGLQYSWYYAEKGSDTFKKATATGNTYSATMSAALDGRSVYCVITDIHGETVTTETVTLRRKLVLTILNQPQNVTVAAGETAATTVEAEGEGLVYAWYFAAKGSTKFSKSSTTTATYSCEMTEARDGRQVYCVITDKYGAAVTTETVTLSMEKTPLTIVTQPSSVTVSGGETAAATVKATGDGLSYAWYFTSNSADTTFSKSSATTATYSTVMEASRDGRQVYCVITDSYGQTVTTETVTLSMKKTPLRITRQPSSVTVVNGAPAKTSVTAEGDGLTYTWYFTSGGTSTKFSKSSVTSATYSTTMSAARDGRQVYCIVTDAYGQTARTETVTLSMKEAIVIVSQSRNDKVANGETASVTVKAEGESLTYTWYYANKGKTKFTKSSYTTDTYATTMDAARDGRRVYCVIKDKYGNSLKTATVTLYMYTPLAITAQPADVTVVEGATAKATVQVQGDGLTYKWYFKNADAAAFTASSIKTATYSTTMDTARDGRQVYCVITDRYGESVTTNTVTLSMKPRTPLAIVTQPKSVSVANGETASATVVAQGDGLTYAWYFTSNASDKTFSKSSTVTATYSAKMDSTRDGRKVYCKITDAYGNTVTSDTVTLSMEGSSTATPLKIVTQPTDVTAANGATAATTVVAQGDGLTYTWYYTSNGTTTKFYKSSTTTAKYSTTMDSSRDGRQVYCVVTDQYGNTVTSNTVTLSMS